ncbi:MAG: hypothetical protein E6G89_03365 [Alphaproteobacteria bacterium]|nr:MAG: hypothetical protein E6G89_03365 [Alphaproteobacteria bacterium]
MQLNNPRPDLNPSECLASNGTCSRGQGSGVRGQGSGVRGQGSGVRGQRSEIRDQDILTPDPLISGPCYGPLRASRARSMPSSWPLACLILSLLRADT